MNAKEQELNEAAGDYLRRARESMTPRRNRTEFAAELGQRMGRDVSKAYYKWEPAESTIPAAAIYAAFKLTGLPVADPAAEQTLEERLRRLEDGLEGIRAELRQQRETRLLVAGGPPTATPLP